MNRLSYWMDTAAAPEFLPLSGDVKCDVVIVGAGITGITSALLLANTGADVIVLEASTVGSGTTGYTTAKVTVQHGLKLQTLAANKREAYAKANDLGLQKVAAFVRDYNIDCDFEITPAYVYTRDENDLHFLEKEMREYEKLSIKGSIVEEAGLPFDVKGALVMETQAQFHPLKYLYALTNELVKKGGRVFEKSRAIDFERQDKCVVKTESGSVTAKAAVLATNYPLVDFPGLFFIKLHQERTYIICTDSNGVNVSGMYINIHEPVNSLRMHYSDSANKLLLAGHGHRTAKEDEDDTSYDHLREFLRADFKGASPEPSHEWSAQDCFTLDKMPYVGPIFSKNPNVYVAAGYEKWGMTNGTAAAMMICDHAAGTTSLPREIREKFQPIRITPASAISFFGQAGTALKSYTLDNILMPVGDYEDLASGQGAVMRVNGKARSVYRDESGELHKFSAHCTHMGCTLEYNEAEKSFDCKCHGSRFSVLGEVLDGPAKQPLEKITEEDD